MVDGACADGVIFKAANVAKTLETRRHEADYSYGSARKRPAGILRR